MSFGGYNCLRHHYNHRCHTARLDIHNLRIVVRSYISISRARGEEGPGVEKEAIAINLDQVIV